MCKRLGAFLLLFIINIRCAFADEITDSIKESMEEYIDKLLGTHNDIYLLVMAIATFIFFVSCFKGISAWIFNADTSYIVELITCSILYIGVVSFISQYYTLTNWLQNGFEEVANLYQYYVTGNNSGTFLSDFITEVFSKAIRTKDFGILESARTIFLGFTWYVIAWILQFTFYLADAFDTLGFATAQLIGVIFIPFIISPATRGIFDSWFKFFCGWGIAAIMLKVTATVAVILIKASVNSIGESLDSNANIISDSYDVQYTVFLSPDNLAVITALEIYAVVCVFLVLSSFGIAKALSGNIGSVSGSAVGGATRMAKFVATKLV